jgi:hypothetical protein
MNAHLAVDGPHGAQLDDAQAAHAAAQSVLPPPVAS